MRLQIKLQETYEIFDVPFNILKLNTIMLNQILSSVFIKNLQYLYIEYIIYKYTWSPKLLLLGVFFIKLKNQFTTYMWMSPVLNIFSQTYYMNMSWYNFWAEACDRLSGIHVHVYKEINYNKTTAKRKSQY